MNFGKWFNAFLKNLLLVSCFYVVFAILFVKHTGTSNFWPIFMLIIATNSIGAAIITWIFDTDKVKKEKVKSKSVMTKIKGALK